MPEGTSAKRRTREEVVELIRHCKAIQTIAMDMVRFVREDRLDLLKSSLSMLDYHIGKVDIYIRKRENQKGGE